MVFGSLNQKLLLRTVYNLNILSVALAFPLQTARLKWFSPDPDRSIGDWEVSRFVYFPSCNIFNFVIIYFYDLPTYLYGYIKIF